MDKKKPEVYFSWRNYTKPTPDNVLQFASFLRDIVATISVTTMIMDANKWVPIVITILGVGLDRAKIFFAHVVDEEAKHKYTIEVPEAIADQVKVTDEIIEKPEDEKK